MLGKAEQCRDAQDGRDLSGYSCGALSLPQPGAVPWQPGPREAQGWHLEM